MMMTEPNDVDLIRAIRTDGSLEATSQLYRRHWPSAWRAAFAVTGRRAMADDLAQEAFLDALRSLDRFDSDRSFPAWLHRITVNRALNALRDERRLVELGEAYPRQGEWVDEMAFDPDLMNALADLSPERRAVVVLHHWFGYSTAEIAEMLETPVGTVYSRLGRALDQLRSSLEVLDANT